MDPTSSWLLPRFTAIGWLNEEDTMSSKHLWWGPFTSTFCEHWLNVGTSRTHQKEVNEVVEKMVEESCTRAAQEERELTIQNSQKLKTLL